MKYYSHYNWARDFAESMLQDRIGRRALLSFMSKPEWHQVKVVASEIFQVRQGYSGIQECEEIALKNIQALNRYIREREGLPFAS